MTEMSAAIEGLDPMTVTYVTGFRNGLVTVLVGQLGMGLPHALTKANAFLCGALADPAVRFELTALANDHDHGGAGAATAIAGSLLRRLGPRWW